MNQIDIKKNKLKRLFSSFVQHFVVEGRLETLEQRHNQN